MSQKKGLLQRLDEGVVIGDGGFVFALEKRGYTKAGPWTPEVTIEFPDAVRQLHREFLRAGSDVMQAFTFYSSDDTLLNHGNETSNKYTCRNINDAACRIAKEVAEEGSALVAGGLSKTTFYQNGAGKEAIQKQFQVQVDVFIENKLDFLIVEYFDHVEEIEWAIEVCRKTDLPVVASMCIGPKGDKDGVCVGECAVRMVKAGAHVVGINCLYDSVVNLKTLKKMKKALKDANLDNVHLIAQPLAFHTPEEENYIDLPEFPFALESRLYTRWDMHKYAREAYDLGVRYIGGCCGFESYHIRAISEELVTERGGSLPPASAKHEQWGGGLKMHTKPWVRARASRDYWEKLNPASGRPFSPGMSRPGVTAVGEDLKRTKEE